MERTLFTLPPTRTRTFRLTRDQLHRLRRASVEATLALGFPFNESDVLRLLLSGLSEATVRGLPTTAAEDQLSPASRSFRLTEAHSATISSAACTLTQVAGRPVTEAEALRTILQHALQPDRIAETVREQVREHRPTETR